MTPATRVVRPRRWPGVVAWTLWALAMVAWLVIPWLDQLLRQAGRPDLVQWDLRPGVALVSAATVGAVLASRRPAHLVGWLLLAQVVSNLATGAAAQYLAWGLLAPGGALPTTRYVALSYPASVGGGLLLLGFVLLLTPTGKLPSPGWGWWASAMVARPLLLVVAVTLAPGSVDPSVQVVGGPFEFDGLGGVLLVVNQLALAFTNLAVVVCAGSLVVRFRRARGWSASSCAGGGGGGAAGGGGGGRAGRFGGGGHRGGHLGAQCLGGRAAGGDRGRGAALSAV